MRTRTAGSTPRKSWPWTLMALISVLALLVAACGGDAGDDDGAATTDGADTTQATETTSGDTTAPETTEGMGYVNPGVGLQDRDAEHLPDNWDEIVAAAAEEGEVIIYTNHAQDVADPMFDAFREAFPDIEILEVRGSPEELPTRYEREYEAQGSNPADLLHSSLFEQLVDANPDRFLRIDELDADYIPTLNDMLPQAFPEDRPYSVHAASYVWNLVYNTDLVDESELPDSFCELQDERWAGAGMIGDPRASTTYRGVHAWIFEECGAELYEFFAETGWGFADSTSSGAAQVIAGAFEVQFPNILDTTSSDREAGAPVAHKILEPALLGWTSMIFPEEPPNPNAQRVLGTFLLGAQAQEIQCEVGNLSSLNTKVGGPCDEIPIDPSYPLNNVNPDQEVVDALYEALGVN